MGLLIVKGGQNRFSSIAEAEIDDGCGAMSSDAPSKETRSQKREWSCVHFLGNIGVATTFSSISG